MGVHLTQHGPARCKPIVRSTVHCVRANISTYNVCSTVLRTTYNLQYGATYWGTNILNLGHNCTFIASEPKGRFITYFHVCFAVPGVKPSMVTTKDCWSRSQRLQNWMQWHHCQLKIVHNADTQETLCKVGTRQELDVVLMVGYIVLLVLATLQLSKRRDLWHT